MENKRKELTKPLLDAKKNIDNFFNEVLLRFSKVSGALKQHLLSYEKTLEQERKSKQEDAIKQSIETGQEIAIIESEIERVDGIKKRTAYKFEIEDESLIPREYLCPDEKKIGAVVRATKGNLNIPGVKIIREEILAA